MPASQTETESPLMRATVQLADLRHLAQRPPLDRVPCELQPGCYQMATARELAAWLGFPPSAPPPP